MITEFTLLDAHGKVLKRGEIDGDIYRVFDNNNAYTEYPSVAAMCAATGGVSIQPMLLPSAPRSRQEQLPF